MSLLLPFAFGLLWHLLWVWTDLGAAWPSLLIAVGVACLLAGAESLVRAIAWGWLRENLAAGVKAVQWAKGYLPAGGGDDGDGGASLHSEPVFWVAAVATGWAVVQFVVELTDDVVGKIGLLAAALVVLGLDVLAGAWSGTAETQEREAAARHLTASLPLPHALGGGGGSGDGKGGRLKFTLDL